MDLQRLALENDANLTTAVLVQQQKLSPPTPFADANDVEDEEDVERTNSCFSENMQQHQLVGEIGGHDSGDAPTPGMLFNGIPKEPPLPKAPDHFSPSNGFSQPAGDILESRVL